MSAETSSARGEWVLVPRWNMERVAETLERDGDEHGAAYELRDMLAAAPPPAAARGDVWGLVAKWREESCDPCRSVPSRIAKRSCAVELAELIDAEGVQPEPKAEARGVVDEVIDYHEFVPQEIYEAAQMIERFMSKKVNTPWAIAGIQSRDLTEARNVR